MISKLLISLLYVRWTRGRLDSLILIPKINQFKTALGELQYEKISFDSSDVFPEVCMCGNIISDSGAYLRLHCPNCLADYSTNQWSIAVEINSAHRAAQSMASIPHYLVDLYYAKAISLEATRNENSSSV